MARADFWEFAADPSNALEMDVIAEGAKLFAEELREAENVQNMIRNVEHKAYPMDTFSVIVIFAVGDRYVSLNLENIRFDHKGDLSEIYAEKRVYVWREDARINFSIIGEPPGGGEANRVGQELILTIENRTLLTNPEIFEKYTLQIKGIYEAMYNALRARINVKLPSI